MSPTTVSVIIPTWNREKTITRAIDSVLNQTYPVAEILVCDDGSTDHTQELILSKYGNSVKWVAGEHSGLPAIPRNKGILHARGEWLAFLDSDDEWLPFKIEKQINYLTESDGKACSSNAYRLQPQKVPNVDYFQNTADAELRTEQLLKINSVICSSMIFHRSLLEQAEKFPELETLRAIEDYALWLRIACITPIHYIATPLLNYFDNFSDSIRKDDVSPLEQKKRVFGDFEKWCSKYRITINQDVKKQLDAITGSGNGSLIRRIKSLKKMIYLHLGR